MINKAQVSRYRDALSVLGLDRKSYADWDESDKALFGELTLLDEKQHTKSSAGMVTKSAESTALEFAIPPMVHKTASEFYVGPRNVTLDTPSWFRYREPGPTCKAVARASLGLPTETPERETHRVISAALAARPWLR